MKKILILLSISLLIMQLARGQKNDTSMTTSPKALHDMYMQKHKTNNVVGWVMLGSGIGMTIGGLLINASGMFSGSIWNNKQPINKSKGLWLSYIGGATTLASIPFFISAGSNKRKASLALKGEVITMGSGILDKSKYMAITFAIQLK